MASENDPTTTTSDEAQATRPKRRRAASKAVAPARSAPEGTTHEESGGDETAAESVAQPASESPQGESPEDPTGPAKAAKKATRKRSAKKAQAGAEETGPATTEPDTTEPEAATASKKGSTKKAATRKRAAKAGKGAAPAPADDAVVSSQAAVSAEAAEQADGAGETEETEETAPAVPSFGLLFQAPEPTVTRRRRATAPSQAPSERPAEAEPSATPATPDGEPDEATTKPAEPSAQQDRADGEDSGEDSDGGPRRRRRGGRGRRGRSQTDEEQTDKEAASAEGAESGSGGDGNRSKEADSGEAAEDTDSDSDSGSSRRRRRRRRGAGSGEDDPPGTVTKVREARSQRDEPTAVKGSTRLEAKKQRRREGREAGRRRTIITEAEFLARRESVDRVMVVRGRGDRTQIGVLEDGVLVEHYVSRETTASMAGNVYLGRVQNVLPSMEAAFVDIGKGRNAVLYAGEVNWDAAGLEGGQARRIEHALKSGDTVLVQVTKDPIGHKGARLTSQISLPGRYLVYVPEGSMTGISRKLPDTERARLKGILKEVVPDSAGVIVRTAAEGASEEELTADVERLTKAWEKISKKAETAMAKKAGSGGAPVLVHGEPDLTVRVIRDVFTEDFSSLVVSGDKAWDDVSDYIEDVAPDLASRVTRWTGEDDVFASHRIDEQIAKAMDRKVWLPSGGSLVIDRTEAMTVVDVNTGKFIGSGGNLEETVTKNNLEAAEEIVRQLRLRDIGGIIVVDFIDMVLESNRDLVVRRLLECLGRDRTKHQVAEVTSLGLVQMTRKRVGSGLIEVFSEPCEHCNGSGIVVHTEPIDRSGSSDQSSGSGGTRSGRGRRGTPSSGSGSSGSASAGNGTRNGEDSQRTPSGPTAAQIAAAAHAAALRKTDPEESDAASRESAAAVADAVADAVVDVVVGGEAGRDTSGDASDDGSGSEARDTGSTVADETGSEPEPAEPAPPAEPVSAPETEPESVRVPVAAPVAEPVAAPARRPRRKRGRVVAPAGPPRPVGESDTAGTPEGAPPAETPES